MMDLQVFTIYINSVPSDYPGGYLYNSLNSSLFSVDCRFVIFLLVTL
ncbi:hypothetical protein PPL_12042 [Heterostelium album PN500]|uniref:Uncharacterized protein n=1 Tax=Heterostelium pallidum (strain ATCC 26659 / Pp 5 / PN500) TaxID=670386 RepID=D3BLI9_HETP5|nr:hypothetical protein PPL_12042 [Heterostelium album PN500]EFA77440.1 hypothetical protein PPL_12042 [Heterostelium album PN500]|eukprot:XP_020429568.1 hypothetical protein PPL_12042 [Heterostelium album PN500]